MDVLERCAEGLANADLHERRGRVDDLIGLIVEATGLEAEVGEVCTIEAGRRRPSVPAEVVGFRAGRTLLMPLGEIHGIGPGHAVAGDRPPGAGARRRRAARPRDRRPRPPDRRPRPRAAVERALDAGVAARGARAAADHASACRSACARSTRSCPCGRGQRMGIFAGSGVGKSSLLGMIARSCTADVNVIALVGERGREVREFIERDLGDALSRSVVVVATSDEPALLRIKAAFTATTVAEHFRAQGLDVMLMMDSVTRVAMAQREVGLAIGEPPATRGYTPSVFALLPRLLERTGTSPEGTITGLYTVLVDGDDFNEPIADAVRSILDGHVVLDRALAHAGHFPAIDVLGSVSRLEGEVTARDVRRRAGACARCWPRTARRPTSSRSGPTSPERIRSSTRRSSSARRSRSSCARAPTSRARPRRPMRGCVPWPAWRARARRSPRPPSSSRLLRPRGPAEARSRRFT